MPDGFPCPNPACTHSFPPESVKGVAALKCPRCGNVFQFARQPAAMPPVPPRPPANPPAPPPPPAAKPVPPPPPRPVPAAPAPTIPVPTFPVPAASAPSVPVARPVASVPVAPVNPAFAFPDVDEPDGRGRPRKRRPKRGLLLGTVLFTLLAAFIGGVVYCAVFVVPKLFDDSARKDRVQANFSFKTTWAWKPDDRARRLLEARVALTRSEPRAHMALAFEDYKTREPSDDELLDDAVRRLKAFFPRLEYVDPIQAGNGKAGDLDEVPAWKLVFRATGTDEVPMTGECLFLTRRGYGYWWITWGPAAEEEILPELWEKLREGFKFHDEREGWQPTPRPTTTVKLDGVGVQLSYVHDLWRPEASPKDYDPAAEVVFRSFEVGGEKGRHRPDEYAGKAATVQVLVMPKAADLKAAVGAAEAAVKKQREMLDLMVKLEPYADPSGKAMVTLEVGAFKGEARQLSVKINNDNGKFAVLAVVNRPGGAVAIYCECPPDKRGYWLGEFKALLGTVRPAG